MSFYHIPSQIAMHKLLHLVCVLCLLVHYIVAAERPPFFESQMANDITGSTVANHDVASKPSDVNADSIIGPIMQPIARMFSYVANLQDDDKTEVVRRKPTSMFDPRAIMDAVSNDELNPTPPPSFMEKLFEPFIAPFKHELNKIKATTSANIFDGLFTTSPTPLNAEGPRRSASLAFDADKKTNEPFVSLFPDITKPESLLKYSSEVPTIPSIVPKLPSEPFKVENLLQAFTPPNPLKPLALSDPLTVNPLMSLFTTPQPIKIVNIPEIKGIPIARPSFDLPHKSIFPLQDPFFNPLFPNRKNKLFDLLNGRQA